MARGLVMLTSDDGSQEIEEGCLPSVEFLTLRLGVSFSLSEGNETMPTLLVELKPGVSLPFAVVGVRKVEEA